MRIERGMPADGLLHERRRDVRAVGELVKMERCLIHFGMVAGKNGMEPAASGTGLSCKHRARQTAAVSALRALIPGSSATPAPQKAATPASLRRPGGNTRRKAQRQAAGPAEPSIVCCQRARRAGWPFGPFVPAGKRTVALRESLRLLSPSARAGSFSAPLRRLCVPGWQTTPASHAIRPSYAQKTALKSPLALVAPSRPDHFNPRFASGGTPGGGEAETQPPAGRPRACTSKGPLERDAGSHALRAVPGTK